MINSVYIGYYLPKSVDLVDRAYRRMFADYCAEITELCKCIDTQDKAAIRARLDRIGELASTAIGNCACWQSDIDRCKEESAT